MRQVSAANVTDTVAQLVRNSGVQEGLCLVNAMHMTAHDERA